MARTDPTQDDAGKSDQQEKTMPRKTYHVVDFKNELPPLALLRISDLVRHMHSGQTIEIRTYETDDWENLHLILKTYRDMFHLNIENAETGSCRKVIVTASPQAVPTQCH
jgi:TusA-related sulfurtransferase